MQASCERNLKTLRREMSCPRSYAMLCRIQNKLKSNLVSKPIYLLRGIFNHHYIGSLLAKLLLPECLSHLFLDVWKDRLMVLVLHWELSLTLSHTTQLTWVTKHVIQSHLGCQGELVISNFGVHDSTLALVDGANDVTLELDRGDDFDGHDRFKDDRPGLVEGFSESTNSSETESKFVRINSMGRTVIEDEFTARNRMAGDKTSVKRLLETLRLYQYWAISLHFNDPYCCCSPSE